MDALDQVGGTPPQIWKRFEAGRHLPVQGGLVRDQVRIKRLARQIEKLSWMLELMDLEPGITLEGAEYQWQHTHLRLG